jgi:hypothetical protein
VSGWGANEAICPSSVYPTCQLSRHPGGLQRLPIRGTVHARREGSHNKPLPLTSSWWTKQRNAYQALEEKNFSRSER